MTADAMIADSFAIRCLARAGIGYVVIMKREWFFCRDDGNHLGRLLPCQGWREWEFCRDDGNHLLDIPVSGILPLSMGSNVTPSHESQPDPFLNLHLHTEPPVRHSMANGDNVAHNLVTT